MALSMGARAALARTITRTAAAAPQRAAVAAAPLRLVATRAAAGTAAAPVWRRVAGAVAAGVVVTGVTAGAVACDGAASSGPTGLLGSLLGMLGGGDKGAAGDTSSSTTTTTSSSSSSPSPASEEPEEILSPVTTKSVPERVVVEVERAELPLLTLAEVGEHQTASSMWVTYEGVVYDITAFLEHHPGGRELLMTAAGLDLGHFFTNYTVHRKSGKAAAYLAGMAIGRLSDEEAEAAAAATTPQVHVDRRTDILWRARRRMVLVCLSLPIWTGVRYCVRFIGFFVPSLGHFLANRLPVSVPGYGGAAPIRPSPTAATRPTVAVIGGGIAGSGAAYTLAESGFEVTLFEARDHLSGNAHTFDWDVKGEAVKSCVSVTAWPPVLYKNYVALLAKLDIKTTSMPLSWFLYSKVPGSEGYLWASDPTVSKGSLRERFADDFERYERVHAVIRRTTNFFTLNWFGESEPSMYANTAGFGVLNPLNTYPLYSLCRNYGISQEWWDVVFQPYYTASFLSDKLDNLCAAVAPVLEHNIPLLPTPENSVDARITTCETWVDAGRGVREVFKKMTAGCEVRVGTRVVDVQVLPSGKKVVYDEHGYRLEVDRVVFACACNAIGNMHKQHNLIEDTLLSTPEYADDWHPASGHMHAIMHSDASIIAPEWRDEVLRRGSNYVEVTLIGDDINIENSYNFGVQTPAMFPRALDEKIPMLISHAMGEGKEIDPALVHGSGNHARAHPLFSGWNVSVMLAMRLIQGRNGIYYCGNWTTPGNCHDMSFLSGTVCAHAIGADYPFADNVEAHKDFERLRGLMGI